MVMILLLYCVALSLSVAFWISNYVSLWMFGNVSDVCSAPRWIAAIIVPIFIAHRGLKKRSLDKSGVLAGLIVGFLLTLGNWTFLAMLLTFFLSSSKATRFRSKQKQRFEDDFKEGGQRNWRQVFCNGGAAAQAACLYLIECGCRETPVDFHADFHGSVLMLAVLGSLAAANADTWASELGTVLAGRDPMLITTLKRVPTGTNGGVSLAGLLASLLGGALVGLACWLTQLAVLGGWTLHGRPPQWPLLTVGLLSGLFGSLLDSLLGATLQYSGVTEEGVVVERPGPGVRHICGRPVIDNHSVNLLMTIATGCVAPVIGYWIWPAGR
ncbi:transmembrane protein 19-like [Pollicipes pollicipes]|uniref:transmembrane protein 19-like n=1 Tax=Pollicipes pollicipes TaxID=41117 RepID=UPI0018856005|nr:transmembrane protein 19-like [Pollicipes pollicipes]